MFPAYAITAVSAGAGCNRFILFRETAFLYSLLVLRYRVFAFFVDVGLLGNYQSGSSDRKYPALHPEHPSPATISFSSHLSRMYRCIYFPSSPPPRRAAPLPSLSLSLNLRSPSFGLGSSRQPGLLRSPTNLFDKSSRLIGWTTRGHGSFSKREIYRGNRFVLSYRPCIYSLATYTCSFDSSFHVPF